MGFRKGSSVLNRTTVYKSAAPFMYTVPCCKCGGSGQSDVYSNQFVCESCTAKQSTNKPKVAKPLTIVRREVEQSSIDYYIRSGENIYIASIANGAACNCKTENGSACSGYFYSKGNKHCRHTDEAIRNEQERGTDLQQHLHDDLPALYNSCNVCGNRCPLTTHICGTCLK